MMKFSRAEIQSPFLYWLRASTYASRGLICGAGSSMTSGSSTGGAAISMRGVTGGVGVVATTGGGAGRVVTGGVGTTDGGAGGVGRTVTAGGGGGVTGAVATGRGATGGGVVTTG